MTKNYWSWNLEKNRVRATIVYDSILRYHLTLSRLIRSQFMEQNENNMPHLLELKDEIQQTRQRSYCVIHQNDVHNSKIGINKTSPDILYEIFALAVYSSLESQRTTALNISHVCHHWREFALEWPVLWAFVTLDYEPSIFDTNRLRVINS